MLTHNDYDDYSRWTREVDALTRIQVGRSIFALTSYEPFFWWQAGMEPDEAASLAVANRERTDKAAILEEAKQMFLDAQAAQAIQEAAEQEAILSYEVWLSAVEKATQDMIGISVNDLPDADFQGMFAAGMEPAEASDTVLMEAGYSRCFS